MVAVWDPNDEVWDLAKGEWAEFYEDTIIYRQLKVTGEEEREKGGTW